jgi:hypothetical protein
VKILTLLKSSLSDYDSHKMIWICPNWVWSCKATESCKRCKWDGIFLSFSTILTVGNDYSSLSRNPISISFISSLVFCSKTHVI